MSARVWVRSSTTGAVKEVAASAVPVLIAAGWKPLNRPGREQVAAEQLAEREAREASLTPASARRAAAEVPAEPMAAPPADEPLPAESAAEDGAVTPKRSGARRRQNTTENKES